MPLTETEIENADLDIQFISAVATTMGTATNRLGYEAKTLPQLLSEQAVQEETASGAAATATAAAALLSNNAIELPLTLATSTPTFKVVESATTALRQVYQNYPGFAIGTAYEVAALAKADERGFLRIYCTASALFNAVFDLVGGTVVSTGAGNTAEITALGSGWYLCKATVTATATSALNNVQFNIGGSAANTAAAYAGDGSSGTYLASVRLLVSGTDVDLWASRLPSDASFTKAGCTVVDVVSTATPVVPRVEALEELFSGEHPAKTTEASGASLHPAIFRAQTPNPTAGQVVRSWARARRAEYKRLNLYNNNANLLFEGTFDLETGIATGTGASMTYEGDGVWLCQVVKTVSANVSGGNNFQLRIFADTGGNPHTGDGVSGIYLLGAGWDVNGVPVVSSDAAALVGSGWTKQALTIAIDEGITIGSVTSRLAALEGGEVGASPFQGMKWTPLGSSITAQNFYTGPLESLTGMDMLVNLGVGGAALGLDARGSPHYGSGVIYNQIASIPVDTQLVTLESGPNDFASTASAVPLGVLGDTTTATYYGALYAAINRILNGDGVGQPWQGVPNAKIVLINTYGASSSTPGYAMNATNVNGNKLWQFQKAVIDVGDLLGIPSIDVGRKAGLGYFTNATRTSDGLHINALGGLLHANFDYRRLLEIHAAGYFTY